MEYLIAIGYILGWLLVVVCCRFVTTTVHELGHALPALKYTQGKVSMHIGSYGDQRSKRILLGRLTAYFKFNPLHLNIGLCQHERPTTITNTIRIILGGPLFSLLLGISLILIIVLFQPTSMIALVLMAFILSSIWDFFINIIPFDTPLRMHDGSVTYNDGRQLIHNLRLRRYPQSFFKGQTYYNEGDYQSAIINFRKTIEAGFKNKTVYHALIGSLLKQRNYRSALNCCEEMDQQFKLNAPDFKLIAHVFMKNGNHSKAIECLDQSISNQFDDAHSYNNRGYSFLMLEEYNRAEADFRLAIRHDPSFGFPYNNLALVYLRKGELDNVMPLIKKSHELQPDNPYLWLHMGYYHEALKDYQEALACFEEAREKDIEYDRIDQLIEETTLKIPH